MTMLRIRELRGQMSQEALALAAGLRGGASISEIENGGNPRLSTLVAIAGALNLTVAELFEKPEFSPEVRAHAAKLEAMPEGRRQQAFALLDIHGMLPPDEQDRLTQLASILVKTKPSARNVEAG